VSDIINKLILEFEKRPLREKIEIFSSNIGHDAYNTQSERRMLLKIMRWQAEDIKKKYCE